jgi:hypothetical protein
MIIHVLLPVLIQSQKSASKSQLTLATGGFAVVVIPALVPVLLPEVVVLALVVIVVSVVVEATVDVGTVEVVLVVVPGEADVKDISSIAISLLKPLPVVPAKRKKVVPVGTCTAASCHS